MIATLLIAGVTLLNIAACLWLIRATNKPQANEVAEGEVKEHVWDDDLRELNNPMPRWWLNLFIITIVFAVGYLVVYPGLGYYAGVWEWSSDKEMQTRLDEINEQRRQLLARYADQPIESIADSEAAVDFGHSIFGANCAGCHGSQAQGALGYPNLTDGDWLYGGSPDAILTSVTNGRHGQMPYFNGQLSADDVRAVIGLLRDWEHPDEHPDGSAVFASRCAACHGSDGTGNQSMGAPDLTDDTWLYGGSPEQLRRTILFGRQGNMPAHDELLTPEEIRLVSGYVYSLSR